MKLFARPIVTASLLAGLFAGHALAQTQTPLQAILQNTVTLMESEPLPALAGEGMTSIPLVVANLNAWATSWCALQGSSETDCASSASIAATVAPFTALLQTDFALVPASQWNPKTFTSNLPANVIGFKAIQVSPTAPVTVPTVLVGQCYAVNGINGPSGIECMIAPGVKISSLTNGQIVSQNGQLFMTHVVQGLMGLSGFFEPLAN